MTSTHDSSNVEQPATNQFSSSSVSNKEEFILPIFPLRKAIKFPTETLTLNLYEERFLALTDYILQQQSLQTKNENSYGIFGGLYCSGKPQMVKDGVGPVTPLIEKGDVGTIFSIFQHSETPETPENGRRVQLKGIGVARFRVETVLHNGFGNGNQYSGTDANFPLPFIVVKAIRLEDDVLMETDTNILQELETNIFDQIMNDKVKSSRLLENICDRETTNGKLPFWFPSTISPSLMLEKCKECDMYNESINDTFRLWGNGRANYARELLSFAMASTLIPNYTSDEMMILVISTSAHNRLNYIQKNLNSSVLNSIWKIIL